MNFSCDASLVRDIFPDCDNPQVGGIESIGVIINRNDIDFSSVTKDQNCKNIVKTLALKSGKKGFSIYQTGNTPFTGTNTAFANHAQLNNFLKQVSFAIFDHSAQCCESIIDQLLSGTFVVILENKYNGSDKKSKYEIFGLESGLKQTEGSRDPYSDDTNGAWVITMQETANKSGLFVYAGTTADTEALIASLLVNQAAMKHVYLSVSPNGAGTTTGAGTYDEDVEQVNISATAASGYVFKKWSDGNTNASRTIALEGDVTLTAEFAAKTAEEIWEEYSSLHYTPTTDASVEYAYALIDNEDNILYSVGLDHTIYDATSEIGNAATSTGVLIKDIIKAYADYVATDPDNIFD